MKHNWLVLMLSLLLMPLAPTLVQADDQPIEPEKAFVLQVSSIDAQTLRAEWTIADGTYLYQNKFAFESGTPGVSIQDVQYPTAIVKQDPVLNETLHIYKHTVAIIIKLSKPVSGDFTLKARFQGCNEGFGICYQPLNQAKTVTMAKASAQSASISSLSANNGDEPPAPEDVFHYSIKVVDGNTLMAHWDIANGTYLYKDKFKAEVVDGNGVSLGKLQLPKGDMKLDQVSNKTLEVYHNSVDIPILLNRSKTDAQNLTIKVSYQGCNETFGLCYPIQNQESSVSLPSGKLIASSGDGYQSQQSTLEESLRNSSLWVNIAIFFAAGLLLAFTPCVFPMIPILSSIIAGQGEKITTRKAFTMSVVYVLAMALTYTIAGVIMGMLGQNVQAMFQNPWILGTFAALFVLLAFSMFGFYELQMPSFIQSRLTNVSNRQQGGTLVGVAVMGLLSALIVGPCVTAPLIGALVYIGQTGDAVLGGAALFALSLGMGVPLVVIGTSAGKFMPRAGAWMDAVKAVFGVMMLGVAIWMLERIIPETVTVALWASLLTISAVYMGALQAIRETLAAATSGWMKLWKGIGLMGLIYGALLLTGAAIDGSILKGLSGLALLIVAVLLGDAQALREGASLWLKLWKGISIATLVTGILMLIGVALGSTDPVQPLRGVGFGGNAAQVSHLPFKQITSLAQLNEEVAKAKAQGKGVMVDFYAKWCVSCKEFEKNTFDDPRVQARLRDVVTLQADITEDNADSRGLTKAFNIIGPPTLLFYTKEGVEQKNYRLVGFMGPDEFLQHLDRAFK